MDSNKDVSPATTLDYPAEGWNAISAPQHKPNEWMHAAILNTCMYGGVTSHAISTHELHWLFF